MQIGKVINLRNCGEALSFFKKNKTVIILLIIFSIGFFIGTVSLENFEGFKDFFILRLEDFSALRAQGNIIKISFDSFLFYISVIVLAFIIGSSILGMVFLPLLIVFCGTYYGSLITLLYSEYSFKGVAFCAIILLPSTVIFAVSLILATIESFGFSLRIAKLTLPKTIPASLYYDFKIYCVRYLFLGFLVLFAALLDGIICHYFFDSFNF